VIEVALTSELDRQEHRVERQHRELRAAQPHGGARAVWGQRRRIRRRERAERQERPLDVVGRAARERREQVA